MKKIYLLLISLVVLVMLSACGTKNSPSKKEIVVGVEDQFAPMGFLDKDSKLVGFDIDYARAAVQEMGYKVKFQTIDWSSKEAELASGRIDLVWNGYTITKERQKSVLFTKPYLANAQVAATKIDSPLKKLADLKGKNIGLQSQSSASEALKVNLINKEVKDVSEYKNVSLALNDLKVGRTDAVIVDSVVMDYYMLIEKNTYKVMDEHLSTEKYGVGIKLGNDKLLKELQTALDTLNRNGTAASISKKWFGKSKVLK